MRKTLVKLTFLSLLILSVQYSWAQDNQAPPPQDELAADDAADATAVQQDSAAIERAKELEYTTDMKNRIKEAEFDQAVGKDDFNAGVSLKMDYYNMIRFENAYEYQDAAKTSNPKSAYMDALVPYMKGGIEELQDSVREDVENFKAVESLSQKMNTRLGGAGTGAPGGVNGVPLNSLGVAGSSANIANGKAGDSESNTLNEILNILRSQDGFSRGLLGIRDPNRKDELAVAYRNQLRNAKAREKNLREKGYEPKLSKKGNRFEKVLKRARDRFAQKHGKEALERVMSGQGFSYSGQGGITRFLRKKTGSKKVKNGTPEERTPASKDPALAKDNLSDLPDVLDDDDELKRDDLDVEEEVAEKKSGYEEDLEEAGYARGKEVKVTDTELRDYASDLASGQSQIHKVAEDSIWKILTHRYIITGYPRLSNSVREIASEKESE